MVTDVRPKRRFSWIVVVLGVVVALFGAAMTYGGGKLLSLGGSAYYLPAGVLMLLSGYFLCRRQLVGVWIYFLMLAVSVVWALWEAGWHF